MDSYKKFQKINVKFRNKNKKAQKKKKQQNQMIFKMLISKTMKKQQNQMIRKNKKMIIIYNKLKLKFICIELYLFLF